MSVEKFSLGSLVTIDDGRIRAAFEQALARCEADCKDRPAVSDPRKVALSCTLVPVINPDGEMESCDVQFQITDSVPKRKSKTYNMRSTRTGLLFNELSPDAVHQATIDEAPGPRSQADAG